MFLKRLAWVLLGSFAGLFVFASIAAIIHAAGWLSLFFLYMAAVVWSIAYLDNVRDL